MQKQKRLKKNFNELRNRFSKEKMKNIRKNILFYFKKYFRISKYLKVLERKNSLTKQEKRDKKHYIKN